MGYESNKLYNSQWIATPSEKKDSIIYLRRVRNMHILHTEEMHNLSSKYPSLYLLYEKVKKLETLFPGVKKVNVCYSNSIPCISLQVETKCRINYEYLVQKYSDFQCKMNDFSILRMDI